METKERALKVVNGMRGQECDFVPSKKISECFVEIHTDDKRSTKQIKHFDIRPNEYAIQAQGLRDTKKETDLTIQPYVKQKRDTKPQPHSHTQFPLHLG